MSSSYEENSMSRKSWQDSIMMPKVKFCAQHGCLDTGDANQIQMGLVAWDGVMWCVRRTKSRQLLLHFPTISKGKKAAVWNFSHVVRLPKVPQKNFKNSSFNMQLLWRTLSETSVIGWLWSKGEEKRLAGGSQTKQTIEGALKRYLKRVLLHSVPGVRLLIPIAPTFLKYEYVRKKWGSGRVHSL